MFGEDDSMAMGKRDEEKQEVSRMQNGNSGGSGVIAKRQSRTAKTLAGGRPSTGSGFAQLMSDLLLDVLEGTIDVKQANAACNVAQTMLKGIEIEYAIRDRAGSGGDRDEEERGMIVDVISEYGTMKPALIAEQLQLPRSRVVKLIEHSWFKKTPNGICLAD